MIGYLTGLTIDKDEKSLLLLAGAVGYRIFTTTDLLSQVKIDDKLHLFIHTAVREDDIALYGFKKKEELLFFEQLMSVSGVGPKMALEILSTPINITQNAIIAGDTDVLTKIKGLGKKTAERVILELKNKVVPLDFAINQEGPQSVDQEAVLALTSLGYEKFEVVKFLSGMEKDLKDTEEIVREFLKEK